MWCRLRIAEYFCGVPFFRGQYLTSNYFILPRVWGRWYATTHPSHLSTAPSTFPSASVTNSHICEQSSSISLRKVNSGSFRSVSTISTHCSQSLLLYLYFSPPTGSCNTPLTISWDNCMWGSILHLHFLNYSLAQKISVCNEYFHNGRFMVHSIEGCGARFCKPRCYIVAILPLLVRICWCYIHATKGQTPKR